MNENILDLTSLDEAGTRELNIVAEKSRTIISTFVDAISKDHITDMFWWFTPLASKNESICNFFYNYCLLILALSLIRERNVDTLIAPFHLIKAIRTNLNGKNIRYINKTSKRDQVRDLFPYLNLRHIISSTKSRVHLLQNSFKKVFSTFDLSEYLLIDTYLIPSEFKAGVFHDRYFCGLEEFLKSNAIYLGQCDFNSVEDGRVIAECISKKKNYFPFEVLVKEDDFQCIDAYYRYCNKLYYSDLFIGDVDVSALVNNALRRGSTCISSMYGILKWKVYDRLLSQSIPAAIIGWNEGQPSSIGVFYMIRKKFPGIPTVGYVTSPCHENNLSAFPSPLQVKEKVTPEYYAVQGEYWERSVKQFCRGVKCINAPSFRYQNVYNQDIAENLSANRADKIVLVLSYSMESSRQLLAAMMEAMKHINGFDLILKNHPFNSGFTLADYAINNTGYMDKTDAKEGKKTHSFSISYSESPLGEVVTENKIAVLCDTTSYLEVVLSGIYTISFVVKGQLNNTCLPEGYPLQKNIAYNSNDIVRYLNAYDEYNPDVRLLEEVRQKSFTPVNEATVGSFISQACYPSDRD